MSKRSRLERLAKEMLEVWRLAGVKPFRKKPLISAIKDALDEN